jgi:signal recognition particle subunit SEC65
MPDHVYVYPTYLSRSASRARGRRVPTAQALPEVTVEQIVEAAKALGLKAQAEPDRQYPREFYSYGGRVKVLKKAGVPKAKLLRQLAQEIRKRGPRTAPSG